MATSIIQSSFSAGEISRNLFGRVDLDKYHVGAALMRNFFVDYRGGASTRPGTEFIQPTRWGSRTDGHIVQYIVRPFIVASYEAYVLEFGDRTLRFLFQGAPLTEAPLAVTSLAATNPAVVNIPANGYAAGDYIVLEGLSGDWAVLNDQQLIVVPIDPDHFYIQDMFQNNINAAGFAGSFAGATCSRVYELTTPYLDTDLDLLRFDQSADVMTLTHPSYPVYQLKRTTPSTFTLAALTVGPSLDPPTGVTATPNNAGTLQFGYVVVAMDDSNGTSEASAEATCTSANLNQFNGIAIDIGWIAGPGATKYSVYKWGPIAAGSPAPTTFGWIGDTTALSFSDANFAPDYTKNPPEGRNPFGAGNPTTSCYWQQRHFFGGITPEQVDASRTGQYTNFDVSAGVLDNDAISISIASRQVNTIKSLVPMPNGLVVLTSGGAFQLSGGSPTAAITPSNVVAQPQASSGANDLPPIVVNYDILFVQNKGAIVRDLAYNFYLQTYYGFDRSALANHLFFGYQLLDWCYQEEPFKVIWAVRNDGKLLSLTYVPEQEVYGWAQHDTAGQFESVCSVPEGGEDVVYAVVRRNLDGRQLRCIERIVSRKVAQVEDSWSVDCALSTVLPRPACDLSVVWVDANTVDITATAAIFGPADDGNVFWFDLGGKTTVTSVTSGFTVRCTINKPLAFQVPDQSPPDYFPVERGTFTYSAPQDYVLGLAHLKGREVTIVADGQQESGVVDVNGVLALTEPATKVVVGLGFTCQLQSLDLDIGDPTIQGKRKKIAAVTLRLDNTRGIKVGQTFNALYEPKLISGSYTPPIPLFSGDQRTVINGAWEKTGRICVQQDAPFPATVLGLIPEVTFGDTQN